MNYALQEKVDFVMINSTYNLFVSNLFSIKGRANRKEYIIRFITMWMLGIFTNYMRSIYYIHNNILVGLFFAFMCIIFIIYAIQVFFVTHRRLHDLNASGWWQLVTFIPFGQLLMIGFIFFKGTEGVNKYGKPPTY